MTVNLSTFKVIKHGTHGYWDVFYGDGWANHFKVRYIKRASALVYVGKVGQHLQSNEAKGRVIQLIKQWTPRKRVKVPQLFSFETKDNIVSSSRYTRISAEEQAVKGYYDTP